MRRRGLSRPLRPMRRRESAGSGLASSKEIGHRRAYCHVEVAVRGRTARMGERHLVRQSHRSSKPLRGGQGMS